MLPLSTGLIFSLTTIPSVSAFTATSWGKKRVDIFGLSPRNSDNPEYWHKYYTSQGGWEPHDTKFENLAGPPTNVKAYYKDVSSVSWGPNHLDFFATVDGTLSHLYWNPHDSEWKGCDYLPNDDSDTSLRGVPATASWGPGRIDVVSRDDNGKYLHLYYNDDDENRWTGWEDPWDSPSNFETDPVIIAPEKGHFDIFGRLQNGTIVHLYWNGEKYSNWDSLDWKAPEIGWKEGSSLTASTWKNGSWDLWALAADGSLFHTFWRGAPANEFFPWENITDELRFDDTPKVVHWSAEHTDIVGFTKSTYYHKFWADGWTQWRTFGWAFVSEPEVVSWGEGHYAVFGIDRMDELKVAMWVNNEWRDWESLGNLKKAESLLGWRDKSSLSSGQQLFLQDYKQGL